MDTQRISYVDPATGTDGCMAPGTETADALAAVRASDDYWTKKDAKPGRQQVATAAK